MSPARTVTTAALLALTLSVVPASAETVERGLLRRAPAILNYLREHDYRQVGVLKFRVQQGNAPLTDNAGLLNLNVAHRLELALVLANSFDEAKQVRILRDASAVAARMPGANHLSPQGRKALFATDYPLAWGQGQARPDAFLTGVVQIRADLRGLTVHVLAFGRDRDKLEWVTHFDATPDIETLVETGASFRLRSLTAAADEEALKGHAATLAAQVQTGKEVNPLADRTAPVTLEVRYDDRPVPYTFKEGRAYIPEPHEGQKVSLVLKRQDRSPEPYGIYLAVNGLNTLDKEQLPPLEARKWVLGQGDGPYTLRGFQISDQKAEKFVVRSRTVSQAQEVYYGADVGTITLVVFRTKKGEEKARLLEDEEEDVAALTRGIYPKAGAANLALLKQELRAEATRQHTRATRGLIEGGRQVEAALQRVRFRPDPLPLLTATLTYYRPGAE